MAIARTATISQSSQAGGVGASMTFSHTVDSGSNRLLVVAVTIKWGGAQTFDAVTWNGTSLTKYVEIKESVDGQGWAFYYLVAPETGTYNIVVNYTTNGSFHGSKGAYAFNYTGVHQTNPTDANSSGAGAGASPYTRSITTIANNCWAILAHSTWGNAGEGNPAASTNATQIAVGANAPDGVFDNQGYGAITPAGNFSETVTVANSNSSTRFCWLMMSIAPGPNIFTETFSETVSISNPIIKKSIRALLETITIADAIIKKPIKIVIDTISLTTSFIRKLIRYLTESVLVSEIFFDIYKIIYLVFQETITATDNILRSISKLITDTITTTDMIIKLWIEIFIDAITTIEFYGMAKILQRIFSETITVTEAFVRKVVTFFSETVTTTESWIKKPIKVVRDAITATDSFIRKAIRILSESITTSEVFRTIKNGLSVIWTKETKPSTSWTKETKPSTSWTKETKP